MATTLTLVNIPQSYNTGVAPPGGIHCKVRDLFPFEIEQLKGLPRSHTRLEIPCASRKEFIMLACDMNVALKFLQHLDKGTPMTMESCSTICINSAKENSNCVYRTKNRYQVLISLVGHTV